MRSLKSIQKQVKPKQRTNWLYSKREQGFLLQARKWKLVAEGLYERLKEESSKANKWCDLALKKQEELSRKRVKPRTNLEKWKGDVTVEQVAQYITNNSLAEGCKDCPANKLCPRNRLVVVCSDTIKRWLLSNEVESQ